MNRNSVIALLKGSKWNHTYNEYRTENHGLIKDFAMAMAIAGVPALHRGQGWCLLDKKGNVIELTEGNVDLNDVAYFSVRGAAAIKILAAWCTFY